MPHIIELSHPNMEPYSLAQWCALRCRLFELLCNDMTVVEYVLSRPPAPGCVLLVMEHGCGFPMERLREVREALYKVVFVPHEVRIVPDGVVINGRAVHRDDLDEWEVDEEDGELGVAYQAYEEVQGEEDYDLLPRLC